MVELGSQKYRKDVYRTVDQPASRSRSRPSVRDYVRPGADGHTLVQSIERGWRGSSRAESAVVHNIGPEDDRRDSRLSQQKWRWKSAEAHT
jgi:hypothetical protein